MEDPAAVVLDVWSRVMGTPFDKASMDDDFFDAGGSSLMAAGIQVMLRDRTGVTVPLGRLMDVGTPRGMAAAVAACLESPADGDDTGEQPDAAPAARPVGRLRALSPGQERLWFLHRLMPHSPFYHVPLSVRLRGDLDAEALRAALGSVVARHEVLRTVFTSAQGRPAAEVTGVRPDLSSVDLSALPADEREAQTARHSREMALRPFDLARDPLLRALLIRLTATEHVLVVVVHHIAYDGASQGIFFRDLDRAYRAARGKVPAAPQLPAQYGDYAAGRRSLAGSPEMKRQLAYWRERLAGAPESLDLPTDRPRPAHQSFEGSVHRFALPAGLPDAVLRLARERRSTPFMVALTAYATVLGAYCGRDDLVIGVPSMSRVTPDYQDLIGFFVNTLPIRFDLTGDPSLAQQLGRVREACISAYENQQISFETLVDELKPRRDMSRAPIVQVLASWEDATTLPRLDDLDVEVSSIATRSTKLDLSLFLRATADGIGCAIEFSTDLFDEKTVSGIADGFVAVLATMTEDPLAALTDVPLVSAAEREDVLFRWNRTEVPVARTTVHELVLDQARATPEAVAVHGPATRTTYRQLVEEAQGLAATLQRHGAGPGATIGILAPRTPHLVTAVLATLLTGAAYTPLDPDYPSQRLRHMIDDAGITTLLTHHDQPPLAEGTTHIPIDTPHTGTPHPTPVHPHDLAYTIYTSGSTGTPKGIGMPHQALVNLLHWQTGRSELSAGAATMQFPAFSFDMSFLDIFYTLVSGRTLTFAPDEVRRDPMGRAAYMAEHGVDCLVLSPAALYQQAEYADQPLGALPGVREIISAGEQLVINDNVREMFAGSSGRVLVNQYGPTETHCMTAYELRSPAADWPVTVPIGKPIANTRAYVLDPQLRPLPAGIPGELYLAGDCLARGYAGRPAMTAERFVPDPYAPAPGARMYRTGDRARWLPDGDLEYLGRLDHQLKVRGYRVEPAEIEAALAAHPGVAQSVVVAEPAAPGADRRLIAYIVGDGVPERELRAFLRDLLPAYLVPDLFVTLDRLPLTPSGKIDRNRLPRPPTPTPTGAGASPEQRRGLSVEQRVQSAWTEVLGHAAIEPDDNFFEIGGNSLRATQLHALLDADFPGRIAMVDLFRYHTVAGQAEHLDQDQDQDQDLDTAARQPSAGPARRQDRLRSQRAARTQDN